TRRHYPALVNDDKGSADPAASAYCHLYVGHIDTCVNDIRILFSRIISAKGATERNINENKRLFVSLMELTIEFMLKCIFKDASQRQVGKVLVELVLGKNEEELFGTSPYVSIVLHHGSSMTPNFFYLLKHKNVLQLAASSTWIPFPICLNYRLLGFRPCESKSQADNVNAVLEKIGQVVTHYDSLDEYLKVVDAFVDNILQIKIAIQSGGEATAEDEQVGLQSILVKLLSHYERMVVHVIQQPYSCFFKYHRRICDPTTIQSLFEISQALHYGVDFLNVKDADNQPVRLISRFVNMINNFSYALIFTFLCVDYGSKIEHHLTFLVQCGGAFGSISGLKSSLYESPNIINSLKFTKLRYHSEDIRGSKNEGRLVFDLPCLQGILKFLLNLCSIVLIFDYHILRENSAEILLNQILQLTIFILFSSMTTNEDEVFTIRVHHGRKVLKHIINPFYSKLQFKIACLASNDITNIADSTTFSKHDCINTFLTHFLSKSLPTTPSQP
ncbi:hypothetical protein UlMin_003661, partial [Ulmus minor]